MQVTESKFIAITYAKPASRVSQKAKAARERLETAIHQTIDRYHNESLGSGSLLDIEFYPCDESCEECRLTTA
jgi:hypothetical protein